MNRFSFSKIDAYASCPCFFQKRYIDFIIPKIKAKPLALGSCMAAGLATFREDGSVEAAVESFIKTWADEGHALDQSKEDDPLRSVERGVEILQAYGREYPEDHKDFIRPEIRFEEEVADGIIFTGRIDGVIRLFEEEDIAIDEDKTASRLGPFYFRQLGKSYQIKWYMLMAKRLGLFDIYPKQKLQCLMNVSYIHKEKFRFERELTIKTKYEIDRSLDDLLKWIKQINLSVEHDIWPKANSEQCLKYGGCDYLPLRDASPENYARMIETMYKTSERP
jgi:hypothetical protein